MKVTKEQLDKVKVALTIEVDDDKFEEAVQKAYKQNVGKIRVDGYGLCEKVTGSLKVAFRSVDRSEIVVRFYNFRVAVDEFSEKALCRGLVAHAGVDHRAFEFKLRVVRIFF